MHEEERDATSGYEPVDVAALQYGLLDEEPDLDELGVDWDEVDDAVEENEIPGIVSGGDTSSTVVDEESVCAASTLAALTQNSEDCVVGPGTSVCFVNMLIINSMIYLQTVKTMAEYVTLLWRRMQSLMLMKLRLSSLQYISKKKRSDMFAGLCCASHVGCGNYL